MESMKQLVKLEKPKILLIQETKMKDFVVLQENSLIQVDIGGHPPFPTSSKQFSGNFGNLLFLAVFRVLNFQSRFEALNDVFWENGEQHERTSMLLTSKL
jgi:hypothetical protein